MSDRITAAARPLRGHIGLAEMAIAAADRWDSGHGWVRVQVDDPALVERIARAIHGGDPTVTLEAHYLHAARSVVAVLGGGESHNYANGAHNAAGEPAGEPTPFRERDLDG